MGYRTDPTARQCIERATCVRYLTGIDAPLKPIYNEVYRRGLIRRSQPVLCEPLEVTMETQSNVIDIKEIEGQTFFESDSVEVPPSDIVAYNELRSCADLFRMYREGILEIQPEFQRQIVWNNFAQTRFIDSLVKQLPIPSMCFQSRL